MFCNQTGNLKTLNLPASDISGKYGPLRDRHGTGMVLAIIYWGEGTVTFHLKPKES
jgi:hypothetical protein